jgi:hypothetical protein
MISMSMTRQRLGNRDKQAHIATVARALARKKEREFAKTNPDTDEESLDEEEVEKPETFFDVVKEAKKTDAIDKKSKKKDKKEKKEKKAAKKAAVVSSAE